MAKDVPADWAKKITHATIIVGDQELTGEDLPSADYQNPQGFSVILKMTDTTEAARIFKALSKGGVIKIPR